MSFDLDAIQKEVQFVAVRSRGPGGQNVNKVSSAALLFWNYEDSNALSDDQKSQIQKQLRSFINSDLQIFLRSDEHRDLPRNKDRCLEKLELLLKKAFFKEKPRKATKPSKASKRKKLDSKSMRGDLKKLRKEKFSYE